MCIYIYTYIVDMTKRNVAYTGLQFYQEEAISQWYVWKRNCNMLAWLMCGSISKFFFGYWKRKSVKTTSAWLRDSRGNGPEVFFPTRDFLLSPHRVQKLQRIENQHRPIKQWQTQCDAQHRDKRNTATMWTTSLVRKRRNKKTFECARQNVIGRQYLERRSPNQCGVTL